MELATDIHWVNNVTSEQLRRFTSTHHETEYAIVDVRQPEEYRLGHIPGAQLSPLGELEAYADRLRAMAGKTIVFYCRSGGRSARAGAWASSVLGLPKVVNLLGGFSAYGGATLTELPRLKRFDLGGSSKETLGRALDMEKGTYRFYQLLVDEFSGRPIAETIGKLAKAEVVHGKAIHRMLAELAPDSEPDFESLFEGLPGDLIESGESHEIVVARARELGNQGPLALLELALEIELEAYDLYKNLAAIVGSTEAEAVLTELAQEEKQHAGSVLRALGIMAE